MLLVVLGWTTFAFGGVYGSSLVVPGLLTLLLVVAYRPGILGRGLYARLDLWLLIALGAAALQVIPLPRALVDIASPSARRVAAALALTEPTGPLPLSIDLTHSAAAVALFAGMAVLFFTARQIFEAGGVRTTVRGTALIGLMLAAVAIAQEATGGGRMYWRWSPIFQRTDPFGPFVNRNHFGTWTILAVPLCLGYLTAHAAARHDSPVTSWRRRVVAAMDGRGALLLASAALMIVALVLSMSRSAILGLAAALAMGMWLAYRHASRRRFALLFGVLAVVAGVMIVVRVPSAQWVDRVAGIPDALVDRGAIWRETISVIREFWLTGTGVGTYQTAMAVFQRLDGGLIYNQAHNHYLQVAAEGGLLVGLPVLVGLILFGRAAARALARDRSGIYWVRAGAASGLAGVAVQSLLETGLLTPANSVLAAIAAAVALHAPRTPNS